MNPIYSMTGFASVDGEASATLHFTLTAKSVNHRFLDLQFRTPNGFDALEAKLRHIVKQRLHRGHVDITLQLDRSMEGELRVNDDLLGAVLKSFRDAASRHNLPGEPDLNRLLRLPGVMEVQRTAVPSQSAELEGEIIARAEQLLDELAAVRKEEGASLVAELRASMHRLRAASVEISELRGQVRSVQEQRLRARLTEMLQGAAVNEDRILTEAALLVERSDIEEENVRLDTHVEHFLAILEEGGEVGKRLDFLLQELNREANTMLSKTGGAVGENGRRITEIGLELKAEIERAREQVQNLE